MKRILIKPVLHFCLILFSTVLFDTPVLSQSWKLTKENIALTIDTTAERMSRDPWRPGYHLTPPAGCMGDPNGGIYHEGLYHIFYGLQPFSSDPGGWYWAHARSADLLHWEHLEPGLTPAFNFGLEAVGSGSTIITDEGQPLAFYSAGKEGSMKFWRAELSKDLNHWTHEEPNPVLTLEHPGLPAFHSFWRDPFVFKSDGRFFMIACADLLDEDYVPVPVFEAGNAVLTHWEYRGILFTRPKHKYRNLEVPELRMLGDTWLFMASTDAPVDRCIYFTGNFDPETLRFIPHTEGIIDYSGHYYAQETIQDDEGSLYLMAWIPGWDRDWLPNFREEDRKNRSEVWNGCFALPRSLSIDSNGVLIQQPVASLKKLRMKHFLFNERDIEVNGPVTACEVLEELNGDQLELQLELELGSASFCGLNVLCNEEGRGGWYLLWSGDKINVDGVDVPLKEWNPGQSLHLQVFIDKQIVEVFINGGRYCVTRKLRKEYIKGDHVALTSLGGHAKMKYLEAWTLRTINK